MLRYTSHLLIMSLAMWLLARCQPSEPAPDTAPIATGRFVSKGGQETTGTFRIVRVEDDLRLMLDDDFVTDEGPDLHVILSPTKTATASGDNAMADETAQVVAPLSSLSGAQQFDLPDDIDLRSFQSVLIHCIRFSHLYGAAPLR